MIEVSIVIPCLNEADTLAQCVQTALRSLQSAGIEGEVIVADNGSTDGSQELAQANGARVVPVAERGYGNALMSGIAAAQGRWIVMADADASYDFSETPNFIAKLREGFELVQGCRLPGGGGKIVPGAMPPLHRWLGNPFFSMLARLWFSAPIHDIYCGMRGFTKDLHQKLDQRCTGMEFATEMIIKASLINAKIAEIPITLHPDGRKAHKPHLRTFRDGWRTLRFFMICSPRWLFLLPGMGLILLGLFGYLLALPPIRISGITFDAHTLLVSSLAILSGYQAIWFAVFAKTFGISEGILPRDEKFMRVFKIIDLEKGLLGGLISMLVGLALILVVATRWWQGGFGPLEYAKTMRLVVPGTLLGAVGIQTIFMSFLLSMLGLKRK